MYGLLKTLLICSILLGSALLSYGETPAPSKSSAPEKERSAERAQNADKDKRGTKESPLSIELLNTGRSKDEAERQAKHEEDKSFREIVLNVFTGILAIATAALAVITGLLVRYTKKLWGATGDLVAGTKETAKEELRAYLGVAHIKVVQRSPLGAEIVFKNTGNTMGKEVEVRIAGRVETVPQITEFPLGSRQCKTVIMPNEASGFSVDIPCDGDEWDLINQGVGNIYVWGQIDYKDVFGKPHWTKFRFVTDGREGQWGWRTKYCDEGNDAT